MSAQDKTEQVLRDIHLMFANSEEYRADPSKVIVEKKKIIELLKRLNACIYELMDEYEMTQRGRDKAERDAKKSVEAIVKDANHKAEDVYAASVIYTDEALHRVQDIMQGTMDSLKDIFDKMNEELAEEKRNVSRNQSELKGHLQDLVDTDKYLKLIEDTNRQIEREKRGGRKEIDPPAYTAQAAKPQIKMNPEYFERAGIPMAQEEFAADDTPPWQDAKISAAPEVTVNLDAEYFRWKQGESGTAAEEKKHGFFSKKDHR